MDPQPILGSTVRKDSDIREPIQSISAEAWPGTEQGTKQPSAPEMRFPGDDGGRSLGEMARRDLVATLQLLAERAQYITGATGSAIALRDGGNMVCRASAGTSAPGVGAQLQVNSGLSGESVRTKQTLRCDDASTDPRVNRESCEALGIASVVVMPLVQGDHVVGVFELFSDKANVFAPRDITALERMGAMVFTALEHAAAGLAPAGESLPLISEPPTAFREPREQLPATSPVIATAISFHDHAPTTNPVSFGEKQSAPATDDPDDVLEVATETTVQAPPEIVLGEPILASLQEPIAADSASAGPQQRSEDIQPVQAVAAPMRSAVANLRKCEGCGFPVSAGRRFCLDCEKKKPLAAESAAAPADHDSTATPTITDTSLISDAPPQAEAPLLFGEDSQEGSWLANHKYMVGAIAVALAGIVALLLAR